MSTKILCIQLPGKLEDLVSHELRNVTSGFFFHKLRWSKITICVGMLNIGVIFVLQTAYAIPILVFAFVCHPEVLPIYSELKE